MGNITRITAFGDVEGNNLDINPVRLAQIRRTAKEMFPNDYDEKKENLWVGLRPVSPDDVPIIGRSKKFENLYFNIG
jgi:D-amino-acid dehydrogenase